jgi:hypothetical protein
MILFFLDILIFCFKNYRPQIRGLFQHCEKNKISLNSRLNGSKNTLYVMDRIFFNIKLLDFSNIEEKNNIYLIPHINATIYILYVLGYHMLQKNSWKIIYSFWTLFLQFLWVIYHEFNDFFNSAKKYNFIEFWPKWIQRHAICVV